MNRIFRLAIVSFVVLGCITAILFQTSQIALTLPNTEVSTIAQVDFSRHFEELEVKGSILIYDSIHDRTYQHNAQRNATAFLPASTFKIPNSLISLETGVISDEIAVLTWDGISTLR